jgi:hypothetical protein
MPTISAMSGRELDQILARQRSRPIVTPSRLEADAAALLTAGPCVSAS